MSTELSREQQRELAEHGGKPIRVVDPDTGRSYVLISGEAYDRLRSLLDDDAFDIRDTYAAQDQALAKVWNDPELDIYNDYESHKPQ